MAGYLYHCDHCGQTKEIDHSMDFAGRPEDLPEEIKKEITCNGVLWKRVYVAPGVISKEFGSDAKDQRQRRENYMNDQIGI